MCSTTSLTRFLSRLGIPDVKIPTTIIFVSPRPLFLGEYEAGYCNSFKFARFSISLVALLTIELVGTFIHAMYYGNLLIASLAND